MNFTINIYLRFALMAVGLGLGIAFMFMKGYGFWGWSFPFLLVGISMTIGYFLLGTVQSGAMMMQTGDMFAAEKRLALTFFPQLLFKPNRAYYFLLKGTIAGNVKDFETSEAHYNKALAIGLPTDNEKAMIYLALANYRIMKSNWLAAEDFFRRIKPLKVTEPQIKEQVKQFDDALKQRGQAKANGFRGGYMPGGKRPRPKMR